MLERAIDAVTGLADDIVVVVPPGVDRDLPAGARLVHDSRPFEGPLAGVAAGLAATDADVVIVVGGDMPSMAPAVLQRLVDGLAKADAALLEAGGDLRPLPLAVRRAAASAAAEALLAAGERRLRALPMALSLVAIPEEVWREDDPDGGTLRDIDEPADLA